MVTHMLLLARQNKISSVHCYSAAPYRNIKVLILSPQWTKFTALFHYLLTLQCLNHSTQKLPSFLFKHDKTTCPCSSRDSFTEWSNKTTDPIKTVGCHSCKSFLPAMKHPSGCVWESRIQEHQLCLHSQCHGQQHKLSLCITFTKVNTCFFTTGRNRGVCYPLQVLFSKK